MNKHNFININYYKAKYQVCGTHTGYNEGHQSNVYGFETLKEAKAFIKEIITKSEGGWSIFKKDFAGSRIPADHKITYLETVGLSQ